MGFYIQLRVNLVKSRKQISKHQNQGYCSIGSFVRKIKEKNISAELSGAELSHTGVELSGCRSPEVSSK